jgi:LysR family glycine cleavage system transcriptional activator
MLPDIESLRCFVAAADLLNFRAAARQVGLSPAALSQRIRAIEDQLQTSLFTRTTRRVHMTSAGLALYPVAKKTLESAAECLLSVHQQTGRFPAEIVIGTRHELGLSWLVPMMPDLQGKHPGLHCHMYFGSGEDLEARVRVRSVDCAITSRKTTDPLLEQIRIHEEEYVFVATPNTLQRHPVQTLDDLKAHSLVDTTPPLPLFSYFREGLERPSSVRFKNLRYMGTIEAIRLVLLQDQGIAVLPRYLIAPDLDAGLLIRLFPKRALQTDWFRLIFRKDDPRRILFESMIETLRAHPLR